MAILTLLGSETTITPIRGYGVTVAHTPTHNRPKVSQPAVPLVRVGVSLDQPNPLRYAFPIDGRSFTNSLSLNLYKQDTMFGGPAQPVSFDWPNPTLLRLPQEVRGMVLGYPLSLPIPLPAGPVTTIYNNPWPRTPTAVYIPMATVDRLPPTVGDDQFFDEPGRAPVYDWPVPKGYRYPTSLWTWAQDLVSSKLSTLVPIPIKHYDRPNPLRAQYPTSLWTFTHETDLSLIGQDGMVTGYLSDQPNPLRYGYPISLRTIVHNTLNYTAFTPFKQTEYPNPVLLKYPSELRTFLQAFENYMQSGAVPFHLTEHPVPKGYAYPSDLRTWMEMFTLSLIGQDKFYGKNGESKIYDYPNPLIKYAVRSIYDPNFGYETNLVPQPPAIGTVFMRKTLSTIGTGVGARKRRKDC